MDRIYSAVEKLEAVIRIQAEVIDELFRLLMQHISAEEADGLQAVKKINLAAGIMRDMEEE